MTHGFQLWEGYLETQVKALLGPQSKIAADPACCPVWCTQDGEKMCCFQPAAADEWVVDLGVGGWSNYDCDRCTEIKGEYTLTRTSPWGLDPAFSDVCYWAWVEYPYCDSVGGGTLALRIDLYPLWLSSTLRWYSNVLLYRPSPLLLMNDAHYRSVAITLGEGCRQPMGGSPPKMPLAWWYEGLHSGCTGTLPSVISAWESD